jgi:hypothetical protein
MVNFVKQKYYRSVCAVLYQDVFKFMRRKFSEILTSTTVHKYKQWKIISAMNGSLQNYLPHYGWVF